jgi:hypothetical protein
LQAPLDDTRHWCRWSYLGPLPCCLGSISQIYLN